MQVPNPSSVTWTPLTDGQPTLDPDGSSNVMYAGTDGLGPLAPGGHIWVATNVSGGPAAWMDLTGGTNPSGFPISGVAIDKSDPTGLPT